MISLKRKKQFAQLESILNQLFEAAYGVEPDFYLMINGCQNYYLPAITKGLDQAALYSQSLGFSSLRSIA